VVEPSGDGEVTPTTARQSIYTKLLVAAAVGLLIWWALPGVPRDQTVIFALGEDSGRVSRLEIHWERVGTDHLGQVTLNFPGAPASPVRATGTTSAPEGAPPPDPRDGSPRDGAVASASQSSTRPTPQRIVHHFRLADGEYSFRISARRTGVANEQTEVTRRVTLNGNTLILRLEELTR
jgi:hypothetical protein